MQNSRTWPTALISSGITLAVVGLAITFMPRPDEAQAQAPWPVAETACHLDLESLSRTLVFVPMDPHERKAAHTVLRMAYAENDDTECRKTGGMVVERFILRNVRRAML